MFSVGDKVRYVGQTDTWCRHGDVGVVVEPFASASNVEWENPMLTINDNKTWWANTGDLELVQ